MKDQTFLKAVDDESVDVLSTSIPVVEPSDWVVQADALIAKQMTELTRQEREKVYHDLHGISEEIEETPPLIKGTLEELDRELKALPDKDAYEMAKSMNPKYVEDPKFRLRFLRADLFDAKKAALRLTRHFQAKLELFGKDKLSRDIVQDDLCKEDMNTLYSSFAQILPMRDQAGRVIAMTVPHPKNRAFSCENKVSSFDRNKILLSFSLTFILTDLRKLRRTFYAHMVMTEDEETQKKGVVFVFFVAGLSSKEPFDREYGWKLGRVMNALPTRLEGIHVCSDSMFVSTVVSIAKFSLNLFNRLRVRTHYGTFLRYLFTYCVLNASVFTVLTCLPLSSRGRVSGRLFSQP